MSIVAKRMSLWPDHGSHRHGQFVIIIGQNLGNLRLTRESIENLLRDKIVEIGSTEGATVLIFAETHQRVYDGQVVTQNLFFTPIWPSKREHIESCGAVLQEKGNN